MKINKLSNNPIAVSMLLLALLVLPVSCKISIPHKAKNDLKLPERFAASDSSSYNIASVGYKQFFTDSTLLKLIDVALQNNLDLKMAIQRIEMARANKFAVSGFWLPQINGAASAGGNKFGQYTIDGVGNYDTRFSPNLDKNQQLPDPIIPDYFLGLQSSWEIDIWRKLKNQKKSAAYALLASESGRHLVVTNLISEVAMQYFQLLELDIELEVVKNNIQLQQRALDLIEIQKTAGRVTELAVNQFDAQLSNSKSMQYIIEQEIVYAENQLNTLLGQFPQPIMRPVSLFDQKFPEIIGAGIPSEMMLNRPDIRRAEMELKASEADVYAARAAFYPSLTINAQAGFNGFNAPLLFDTPGSLAYKAFAGLAAPIFNRRGIKGNYRRARANNLALLSNYQKTIINAYSEVLTEMKGIENYRNVYENKTQQVKLLQNAVSTSNDLFINGFATYLEVVTAQKSVFEAELGQAEALRTKFNYLISLYRSLGGGVDKQQ